jgi:hypothetical protein
MEDATAESMVQTALWLERNGHTRVRLGAHDAWIHMARNRALSQAIAMECDLLLMQDADVAFDDDVHALGHLIQTMGETGAAVVGAAVRRRSRVERIAASTTKPNQIVELEHVGTGLMLIDVAVAATIEPPWFDVELNASGTGVTADEGPTLCRKLRAAGHTIVCDFTFPTLHWERRALPTAQMIRRTTTDRPGWTFTKQTLTPGGNSAED